jgi:hypothetical protein
MRIALAEKLLVKVMNWTPAEVAVERPLIQAMANFKYDEYQQFSPGIRFTESLARWLDQFDSGEERNTAYNFIKSNLIFISNDQVSHLVNICFDDKMNPILLGKAANLLDTQNYLVKFLYNSNEYKELRRRSLFLGASDGSKIDQLRRSSGISNEQVFSSYYISSEKIIDMLKELKKDGYEGKFNSVFLVDDFTGSGLSYFRNENGLYKGKIHTFLELLYNNEEKKKNPDRQVLSDLINSDNLDIHIIFYIAKRTSVEYLDKKITEWKTEMSFTFNHSVDAIQFLDDDIKEQVLKDKAFIDLAEKYFDQSIVDSHYEKGKHEKPYLGFDECALPLILYHNTPNNTMPILWLPESDQNCRGLFSRVTRHKE